MEVQIIVLLIIGIGCELIMIFANDYDVWYITWGITVFVSGFCLGGVMSLVEINVSFFGETGYILNVIVSIVITFVIRCIIARIRGKEARDDKKRIMQIERDEKARVVSDKAGISKSKKYLEFVTFTEKHIEYIARVQLTTMGMEYIVYFSNFSNVFIENKRTQTWVINEDILTKHYFMSINQGERNWTPTEKVALQQLFQEHMDKQKSLRRLGNGDTYEKIPPKAEVNSKRPY